VIRARTAPRRRRKGRGMMNSPERVTWSRGGGLSENSQS
jgi:hypothetical protein